MYIRINHALTQHTHALTQHTHTHTQHALTQHTLTHNWCLRQDEDKEEELKKAFDLQMVELHKYLDSVQHSYLSGEHPTRADCSLAPKLFHALTVLRNVKHYKIPPDAPSAKEYTDRIFSHKDFKESGYPKDYVLHGWAEKLKASK